MYTREPGGLIDEAQRWERVLKTAGPAELAAFVAWIKRSPQHLDAYLQNLAAETELQQLDSDGNFDIEALLVKSSSNVIQLTSSSTPRTAAEPRPGTRWRVFAAIGISGLLAICSILGHLLSSPHWTDYATATGEQRRIVLPDGSSIELNTQSQIRVSLGPKLREVELRAGEVAFDVKHDSMRPFRVHVRNKIVEDLGTQFSIYLRPDASTTVSVLNGRIRILSDKSATVSHPAAASEAPLADKKLGAIPTFTQLSAGEEVHITTAGSVINRTKINVAEAAAWREHRLWFEAASLVEVAAEFNRYNKRQLRVGNDAVVFKKRYTATFNAYDPDSFVQALRDDPELIIQSNEESVFIRARN